MLRILLVDKNQPVIQDDRLSFTRPDTTNGVSQTRQKITQITTEQPPFDLITIGHGSGYGFSLVTAVPYDQRGRVVIISVNPFPPAITDDYSRLGVTLFSGREDAYAQFIGEWAARQPVAEPPADPGAT